MARASGLKSTMRENGGREIDREREGGRKRVEKVESLGRVEKRKMRF